MSVLSKNKENIIDLLTPWLKDKLSCDEMKLESLGVPETTGFSNETLSLKSFFTKGYRTYQDAYVLRLKPTTFQVFPEYDLSKQVRIMKVLRKASLPVPEVLWEEENSNILGTPFYVMRWVEGEAPSDNPPFHMDSESWMSKATPQQRIKVWWGWVDYMSKIHLLDINTNDLSFLERSNIGKNPLDQDLSYYETFLSWSMQGENHNTCDQVLAWLKMNKPTIHEPKTLCWGDCRCGNILYKKFIPKALLDWEMASLGNPLMDVAWGIAVDDANSLGLNVSRLKGCPNQDDTIERWIKNTGFSSDYYSYYRVLALFKFSVIMVMTSRKMIATGFLPEDSDYYVNNHVTQYLNLQMEKI